MRKVKIIGLAVAAMLATTGIAAGAASANAKYLEISTAKFGEVQPHEELGGGYGPSYSTGISLATTHGAEIAECGAEWNGALTKNDAKTDTWAMAGAVGVCTSAGSPDGEFTYLGKMTFGVSGNATVSSLEIRLEEPAPYEHCRYNASKLKGSNTTSGLLRASFSGKLTGKGCRDKVAHVRFNENEWYAFLDSRPPNFPELNVSVK